MRSRWQRAGAMMSAPFVAAGSAQENSTKSKIRLPGYPGASAFSEAVLFGFDNHASPFLNHAGIHLVSGSSPQLVLPHGPPGAVDEVVLYYGSVIQIKDRLHMWYNGNHGPLNSLNTGRTQCRICYATSSDGIHWDKPSLGLAEFGGSTRNNIVDLTAPGLWSTFAVIHEVQEPNSEWRFKAAYEAYTSGYGSALLFCATFSPDGPHWKRSSHNPVGPFLEMAGVTKYDGLYYVFGQNNSTSLRLYKAQRVAVYASANIGRHAERWRSIARLISIFRRANILCPLTNRNGSILAPGSGTGATS